MKHRITIVLALTLILLILFFMVRDFYFQKGEDVSNPYEYDLSDYREIDTGLYCYSEVSQLDPGMDAVKGIAVDNRDAVYVAGRQHVVVFDRTGLKIGELNVGDEVNCIAVGTDGEIYLGIRDHVEVVDLSGELLNRWESPGERTLITCIAAGDSTVYVADAGYKVVHQYDLAGNLLKDIGRRNKKTGEKGFVIPSPYFDLLLGREDELWVVNPGMHALQSYNYQGEQISSWSRTSMQLDGFSGCCNPSHIAMLSNGSFVTSEKGIERVKVHLPSGDFQCVVAGPRQFEPGTVGLDLAVDSEDRIYILDPREKLVRIFAALKPEI